MAEYRQFTGDPEPCLMKDKSQAEECTELEPLILPQGVTPYVAARLTTSILMRQAYCSTCPWTQWLLLASVAILHGQATPTLDSITLHMLQGTMNEKLASNGGLSGGADDTNSFESGNTPDNTASVPFTEDLDGDVSMLSTFDVEPSPTAKECNVTEDERREKIDNLEKENTADDTTLPFTGDNRNTDSSLLEPSHNSKKCTVTEDKNTLELSLVPLKNSTPKPSSISPIKKYLYENENSFNVIHHSPKDCHLSEEKHNHQTNSGSPEVDTVFPQKILSSSKENNNPNEKNCIKPSQDHHKKNCPPGDNLSIRLSHTSEKQSLIKDVRSSGTDNTSRVSPRALVQQKSIGIQVNPRKLGILTTKWVQVKGPRLIDIGVQAEHLPSYETEQVEKCDAQIQTVGCTLSPPKTFADKEVQTIMNIKRDKSSQTGHEDLEEKQLLSPLWNIISLSDSPQKNKADTSGEKSKLRKNVNDGQREDKNLCKRLEGRNRKKSIVKGKQLFHGRPMLKGKLTKPLQIPLDAVVSLLDPALQDPRLLSS